MNKIVIILSVDWEPDHGNWHLDGGKTSYSGILKGTSVLEEILDEMALPCTWFVETSIESERNTPVLFPETVQRLAARKRDEIGLHIHWRRHRVGPRIVYETADIPWLTAQVEYGVEQLAGFRINPKSFRSGALLYVKNLPQILGKHAFTVDSSTLWGRSYRLNEQHTGTNRDHLGKRILHLMKKYCGYFPQPYFADTNDVERAGKSEIVEIPVLHNPVVCHPLDKWLKRMMLYKASRGLNTHFLTLFFHIDELLNLGTSQDHRKRDSNDKSSAHHLVRWLEYLKGRKDIYFTTMTEAKEIYEKGLGI